MIRQVAIALVARDEPRFFRASEFTALRTPQRRSPLCGIAFGIAVAHRER